MKGDDGPSGLLQARPQGFARQIVNDRTQQGCHTEWDIARERDRFARNVDAIVALLKEPVAIQSPQKTAVYSGRQLVFGRLPRCGDLVNPLAVGTAVGPLGIKFEKLDRVLSVEYRGEQKFRLHDPHIDQELISFVGLNPRIRDIRPINVAVVIVILDNG